MLAPDATSDPAADLVAFIGRRRFKTTDPPWQFTNRTGKMAPEHRRLSRYRTMSLDEIRGLPISLIAADPAPLPVGSQRLAARGPRGHGRVGLRVQIEHHLA